MYLRLFREAGVDCLVQNVGAKGESIPYMTRTLARNAYKQDGLKKHVTKAINADDVREAKAAGRLSIVWSTNGVPMLAEWDDFERELLWPEIFWRLGVRMMHLTYNRRNHIASGCTETHDGGLSDYGHDVVRRMNEIGIIVDTAHTGTRSTLDAAKCSSKPMVASHTGCDALFHHDRNKTDKEIRAIAKTGGLIGIYTLPAFLGKKTDLRTMLDHIEHVTKLVGVDHVTIATDHCYLGPKPKTPKEARPPIRPADKLSHWRPEHRQYANDEHVTGSLAWLNWPYFTVGLVQRGYSDQDIEKILALNFLRVFGECCGGN